MSALIVFTLASLLAFVEARRRAYDDQAQWSAEVRASLVLGAAALLIDLVLPSAQPARTWEASLLLWIVVFVADDFLYYVSHRMAHRINLFWASHAVHHSPVRYNLFTGLRQPPTWLFTPAAAAPVMLLAFGAPPVMVAASATLRAVHHFLIHTERVRRLPRWLEWVFNTPSHHRVHHSKDEAHLDRNFGGVLIVWDRLLGTFTAEPDEGAKDYGLVHPSRGGVWDTFADPWRRLFVTVRQAAGPSAALAKLLAPPGA